MENEEELMLYCLKCIENAVKAGLRFDGWSVLDLLADDESLYNLSLEQIRGALVKLGYKQYK